LYELYWLEVVRFFLNNSGTVWNAATKLCMLIDNVAGQVLVVKNL